MARTDCPSCGHSNNPGANFCGVCGRPLSAPTPGNAKLEDPQDLLKILEITNAINSTLNLEKVLNLVLDYSVEITQGQRGFLILRGAGEELEFKVARNMQQGELGEARHDISRRALQMAIEKGEIVATVSAQQDSLFSESKSVFDLDLQTIVCIPLMATQSGSRGREDTRDTIGAIYIDSKLPVQYFTVQKHHLIRVLANGAAIAIENARLYKQLEEQKATIQASASNLEQMVSERTHELDQKNRQLLSTIEELKRVQTQLVQSEKMATVGILAGGVAHEINNPLGSILSNVQRILRHGCQERRHSESADIIQEGARRCRAIVENLLAFSRQSDGTSNSLDLNEIVEKTLELLDHHFALENIQIRKEFGALPAVFGNRTELSQVVTNLLVNARDSICANLGTSKHSGTIRIKTSLDEGHVILEIGDDGQGIDADKLGKLFDPFYTTKEVGQGTGLGLYVSLGIVQRHGGRIEAESAPGQGALFRVVLPTMNKQPENRIAHHV